MLYTLDEYIQCRFSPDDVFLGHPYFPAEAGKMGVTELSIRARPGPRIFALISPLHCNASIQTQHINLAFLDAVDKLMPNVDVLFAVMGPYWWDQWLESPYAHWIPKMSRLDMAVDVTYFPRIKTGFNPCGKRGFLYIGRNDPMKGTNLLSRLARAMPESRFGWIGYGEEIKGVQRVSPSRPLTPEFMATVAEDYDFFISPSAADPNPTTILESMAWGFPVVCTLQSGYYQTSYRRSIYHNDLDRSVSTLRELQFADMEVLHNVADEARTIVEQQYTWDIFVGRICQRLGLSELALDKGRG